MFLVLGGLGGFEDFVDRGMSPRLLALLLVRPPLLVGRLAPSRRPGPTQQLLQTRPDLRRRRRRRQAPQQLGHPQHPVQPHQLLVQVREGRRPVKDDVFIFHNMDTNLTRRASVRYVKDGKPTFITDAAFADADFQRQLAFWVARMPGR